VVSITESKDIFMAIYVPTLNIFGANPGLNRAVFALQRFKEEES
jgi:hypothetical protein